MIDLLDRVRGRVGSTADAAASSGSVLARIRELLDNRITSSRATALDRAGIRSVQYGATSGGTATITSVTTSKAFVIDLGSTNGSDGVGPNAVDGRVTLASATSVTSTGGDRNFCVVEVN